MTSQMITALLLSLACALALVLGLSVGVAAETGRPGVAAAGVPV